MVTDETICFSVHGGVDRKRLLLVVVDGGRAEQDPRAAAATPESGLGPGSHICDLTDRFEPSELGFGLLRCIETMIPSSGSGQRSAVPGGGAQHHRGRREGRRHALRRQEPAGLQGSSAIREEANSH